MTLLTLHLTCSVSSLHEVVVAAVRGDPRRCVLFVLNDVTLARVERPNNVSALPKWPAWWET